MGLGHTHTPKSSGRALFWTIVFNLVITAAQFVAGFLTGFLALIADAAHNLSDVAALLLAHFGERAAQAPATKTATYGKKRAEVLTALISAISLIVVAGFILYEAYERLIDPQTIENFPVFLTVATVGLLGNLASVWILGRDHVNTLNRKAALLHMIYDALSSVAVIVGGIVIFNFGWAWLDPALSALIALLVIWSAVDVLKVGGRVVMEAAPANLDFDEVKSALESHSTVCDVHDLHIWSLSSTEILLSCHVTVIETDLMRANKIIEDLNEILGERFGITHATIQIESGGDCCPSASEICGAEPSN